MNQSVQSLQSLQSDTMYVHAYNITRSLTSFQKFNIVAVDRKGEQLATVAVDMDFEDAASMTEALNGSVSDNEARNGSVSDNEARNGSVSDNEARNGSTGEVTEVTEAAKDSE